MRKPDQTMHGNSVDPSLTDPRLDVARRCAKASMARNESVHTPEIDPVAEFFEIVVGAEKQEAIAHSLGYDPGHFSRMKRGGNTLPYEALFRVTPAKWLRLRARIDEFHGTASAEQETEIELQRVLTVVEALFRQSARRRAVSA
jgi:hypothetical protein